MTTSRTLLRTVLPPVLALGLAALMVHPLGAVAPAAASTATSAGTAALADRDATEGTTAVASTLVASIPPVAFQQRAVAAQGRLRTAVLVGSAEPAGTASVVGIPDCTVAAAAGVPAWLDCPYDGTVRTVTVRVALADGRVFADSAVPVTVG